MRARVGLACASLLTLGLFAMAAEAPQTGRVTEQIRALLKSDVADARVGALEWLLKSDQARDVSLAPELLTDAKDTNAEVRRRAVRNLGWVIAKGRSEEAMNLVLGATADGDAETRAAAFDVLRDRVAAGDPTAKAPVVRVKMAELIAKGDPERRGPAADVLLAMREKGMGEKAEIDQALRPALAIDDRPLQEKVAAVLGVTLPRPPAPKVDTGMQGFQPDPRFDFGYFAAYVQPALTKRYALSNGAACTDCHVAGNPSAAGFAMVAPAADGRYTLSQLQENYRIVLAQVNRANPLDSMLLRKALNNRVLDGRAGVDHAGGIFWDNDHVLEYQLAAAWVGGAKIGVPVSRLLSFDAFVQKVQPILNAEGADGDKCVNCHSTHIEFHLIPPERTGFTAEQLRANYENALKVAEPGNPSGSLLVNKPTWDKDGANGRSHAGGIRFPGGATSPQDKALAAWVSQPLVRP